MGLLRADLIRAELGINDAMAEKVQEVVRASMESGREAFQGFDFRNMTEEQRLEFREKMQQRGKDLEKKIAEVIGMDKFGRLKEIEAQVAGVDILRREEVGKFLGLSEEQQGKIDDLFAANREKMGEVFRGMGGMRDASEEERREAREKMQGKMQEVRKELQGQVMGVLNGDQKKKLGQMMGEPFAKLDEFREQMRAGGRGGRGFGGGQGGRPGGGEGRGGQRGGQRGEGSQRRQRPA
jgi:hypothetical protein